MTTNKRANFSEKTKRELAKLAGNLCSFPKCGKHTFSENKEENGNKSKSTGVACHIYSAVSGNTTNPNHTKRINTNMTPKEISSIENGIWLCSEHGRLIDTDEKTYTAELLHYWKEVHQNAISILIENNKLDFTQAYKISLENKIFESYFSIESKINNIGEEIKNILDSSTISVRLEYDNELLKLIKEFIMEYILNAQEHGKATSIKISIKNKTIKIKDNGKKFNVEQYNITKGGGATKIYKKLIGKKIFFNSSYSNQENRLYILIHPNKNEIEEITHPCFTKLEYNFSAKLDYKLSMNETLADGIVKLINNSKSNCSKVYIHLPEHLCISMFPSIREKLNLEFLKNKGKNFEDKTFVFVISPEVSDYITEIFKDTINKLNLKKVEYLILEY